MADGDPKHQDAAPIQGMLDGMNELAAELLGVTIDPAQDQPESAAETQPATNEVFEKNCAIISLRNPNVANALRQTKPAPNVRLDVAPDGGLTGTIEEQGKSRALASKRAPIDEASRLAASVDVEESAIIVICGFGVGHHVRAIAEKHRGSGVIVVYEPDLALLRAVLERENFVETIGGADVRFVTDAQNEPEVAAQLAGVEGLVSMGVKIVNHPASTARLGSRRDDFGVTLARVVSAIRTHVVTTLMQSGVTIRNELMNLDHYAAAPGVSHLRNAAQGRHAVVVSAGPSFRKNVELLKQPGIRDRVVIIAVQTVLKPMLEMGIKPHFVTALDFHEISTRFYDGLTAADVEGVTLVAEPKANPAITSAFPGQVLCVQSNLLDKLLGDEMLDSLGGTRGQLERGATVAHLAYYLARYLGCDPVALIGQDLAFTDGQYYAANAAIHNVWANELGEFNTLEMMEWQRIVRMRQHLHSREDTLGRHVYTDEQMVTYLMQFERDFLRDKERGLLTIDATEGGIFKQGTVVRPLSLVLEDAALRDPIELPAAPEPETSSSPLIRRVRDVRAGVWKVGDISRKSAKLLEEMADHQEDTQHVNRLIHEIHDLRDEVRKLEPAMDLVQTLNQTGTLKRARADRDIYLEQRRLEQDTSLSTHDRKLAEQRARMKRDLTNVQWLADAADEMGELLDSTVRALQGQPKLTRDPAVSVNDQGEKIEIARLNTWAVIPYTQDQGVLGTPRDLGSPLFGQKSAIEITLERLAKTSLINGAVLITPEPERLRSVLAEFDLGDFKAEIMPVEPGSMDARLKTIRVARSFASELWRGGLGGWTVWDEVYHPALTREAAEMVGADAIALLGPDWCGIDPDLTDACVERLAENPTKQKLTFSPAACGLSPCVLARELLDEIADKSEQAGTWGSIGALLGYVPAAPTPDPIGKEHCVQVPSVLRDAGHRYIADTPAGAQRLAQAFEIHGLKTCAENIVSPSRTESPSVREVIIDASNDSGDQISTDALRGALTRIDGPFVVTLSGIDRLGAGVGTDLISAARACGALSVHVRTGLGNEHAEELLQADIVSCDLHALSSETFATLTGRADFEQARSRFKSLLDARVMENGVPRPWIVPRITRRDAVYEQIESFYDESLMACGAAVIDSLPETVNGERIAPLPIPEPARERIEARQVRVSPDGEMDTRPAPSSAEAA